MTELIGHGDLSHGHLDHHLSRWLIQPCKNSLNGTPALRFTLENDHITNRIDRHLAVLPRNRGACTTCIVASTPRRRHFTTTRSRLTRAGAGSGTRRTHTGPRPEQRLKYGQQRLHCRMARSIQVHAAASAVLTGLI